MQTPTTLVFLHFLGGSGRTWAPLIAHLDGTVRTLAIDLPGFGAAAAQPGDTVADMAEAVTAAIVHASCPDWTLVGHSMGAKIACLLARRAEDGDPSLTGLQRLVLMAGSPPAPEPMAAATRQKMLDFFKSDPATHRQQAQGFVSDNVTNALPTALNDIVVDDVLRADPDRWRAWLRHGSNEDWSDRVGILHTPALILAGSEDLCLGPAAQDRLMAPHFTTAHRVDIARTRHLLPLENPRAVAALIREHTT